MQLNRNDITEKLKEILVASDPKKSEMVNRVKDDSSLAVDLGLTSVGMLYMVIVIEESFNVSFDDVGLDDFKTFGDIVDYIEKNQK